MIVVDTNNDVSGHLAFLRSKGVGSVGRYYSSSASKRISRQEALAISNAGMQIFIVMENSGDPLLTQSNGIHHAQIAAAQARSIGQPENSAIYFALEHLPNGYKIGDLPSIKDYMRGINQVLGTEFRIGVYSDGVVCEELLKASLCSYTWLSASSSFAGSKEFYKSNRWSLAQNAKIDQDWNGISIDTNEAQADYGAFKVLAGHVEAVAAFADAALLATGTRFMVRKGRRYSATVTLFGLEQLASNDMIAERFKTVGFADIDVSGSGRTRQALGTWTGEETAAELDSHVSDVREVA